MEKKGNSTKSNKKGNTTNKNIKKVSPKTDVKKETKKVSSKPTVKKEVKKVEVKEEKVQKNIAPASTEFAGDEIRKLLIIIGAVCAVMLSFYFITEFVLKNKEDKKDNGTKEELKVEPEIQYEEILLGTLFEQDGEEYYVLAYTEDDNMLDIYNQYIETYNNLDEHLNIYKANLSDDFNKMYVADKTYIEGNDITKIKVKETTLIRVRDNEIYKYYEGYEAIKNKLKSLSGQKN